MTGTDCDDLFQETWIKVWQNLQRFDTNRPFGPWLFTIASNLCKNRWRKQQTREKYEKQVVESPIQTIKLEPLDMKKALLELPTEQRNAIVLRYYEGFTELEVASITKCRLGTVKSRVFRAIRKLREVLKNNE